LLEKFDINVTDNNVGDMMKNIMEKIITDLDFFHFILLEERYY